MGCDGGTIPRRDELVKVKKKDEVKDRDAVLAFQWRCCYLSQQALQKPIVMCGMGHLYNKLSVIEGLLNRTKSEQIRHIKSLKDVKELNFTANPVYDANRERNDGSFDDRLSPYICPVTGMEITGRHRFVALWSCGCVFSEKVLKQVATTVCHKCQKPFVSEDVVVLNGTDDDADLMRSNMEARQQKNKKSKKPKSEVKSGETVEPVSVVEKTVNVPDEVVPPAEPPLPATVSEPQKAVTKSIPSTSSVPSSSKIVTKSIGGLLPSKRLASDTTLQTNVKKMKKDYSIAKDQQASDVYKSLFTTHESENQQTRAHWVTYNPFYN